MSLLSRSLLALLVLCATAAFAKGTDTPGWIKATWSHADQRLPSDDLVRQFPVHGIFSNVAFVVGVSDIIPRLEALGFSAEYFRVFDPTEDLYVAQFNRVANLALADFGASKELQQRLVLSLFESGLAVVDSDSFLENNDRFSWAPKVEIASLSKKAFVPVEPLNKHPLYERLMNVTYDPRIARVLDAISVDTLYTLLFDLTEGFFTRQSASSEIREAQSYLEDAFNGLGLNVSVHSYRDDYAANICADFLGSTNPEQLVITGAHYDSRSIDTNNPTLRAPGAVDNGSGTVGMIEMARVLVESQIRLANTVRICVWTGEEQGLLGSKAYAQKLNQEGANILAYFNADMTGYQLPNTPITLGMKDKSITQWLLDLSYVITGLYVPQMPVALSASCCSDYISFFELGYPSIGYFQNAGSASDYPDYHKSTDSLDKVNFQQVRLQTQAVLAAVLTFAEPL